MASLIGDAGTTWYRKSTPKPVEGSAGPVRMAETWVGAKSSYDSFKSAYIFGQAHADYPALILHDVSPKMSGTFGEAELNWINSATAAEKSKGGGGRGEAPPPVGSASKRLTSGELEVPISTSLSWSASWEDEASQSWKKGIEAYLIPLPMLVYTYVSDVFTFTEADITSHLFRRSTADHPPMGLAGAINYDRWMLSSREADDSGDGITVITSTWRYAPDGWDSDLYPDAN
jgi:hypothetical protein